MMALLKFMRDTTENMRAPYGHDKYDIYLSSSKFDLDRCNIYFACAEIIIICIIIIIINILRIIICTLLTNENTGI